MMNTNHEKETSNKYSANESENQRAGMTPPSASTAKLEDHAGENKLAAPHTTDSSAISNRLELLEERPVINKERLDVGKVTVTKHTRTKSIEVPIELVEEYVTIRTEYNDAESQDLLSGNYDEKDILRHVEPSLDSKAVVTINGKQIEVGDAPVEIVLSRQVATITKDTYAIQEIEVNKTTHTHTDSIQVELQYEELDVTEEGFLEHETSRVRKD